MKRPRNKKAKIYLYLMFGAFAIVVLWFLSLIFKLYYFGENFMLQAKIILFIILAGIIFYFLYSKENLTKENFKIQLIHEIWGVFTVIILFSAILSYKWFWLIISFVFLMIAGFVEGFAMYNLLINKKESKRNLKNKEISSGILWVHGVIHFIKKNSITIYYPKKAGFLSLIIAYFIMFLYIALTYWLYDYTKWALLIYFIPVITNIYHLLKYNYIITDKKK